MKQKFLQISLGTVAALWLAAAQAAAPNPRFLGTWEVDFSKSSPPAAAANANGPPPPKSFSITLKDIGGGQWSSQPTMVAADGTRREMPAVQVKTDGTPSTVPGNPRYDSVTLTAPDASTVVITSLKAGKTVSTETSRLSTDGRQVTLTTEGVDPSGKPVRRTMVLNKIS